MSIQIAASATGPTNQLAIPPLQGDGNPPPPPLENGDRLNRIEFERRWDAMPHVKKAELIEGVVYMASPVGHAKHGEPHSEAIGWLALYRYATPGVKGGAESSIRLDLENMPQPDAFLYIPQSLGGRIRIDEDDYVIGTPELVVEVASSSASYDLHAKLRVYQRNGTPEYVVWRTRDKAVDWFILREGRYERLAPGPDGILRSEVFPGLWLDPDALMRDDRAAMLRVNQLGTTSAEHSAFVTRLNPKPSA